MKNKEENISNDCLIRVLPDEIINKIAAGEVVERPASVVKELLENSIDAKARRIDIEIKDGGQKLIEIGDDGVGMSPQDAVAAFTRHATSKIESETDLTSLQTLGFRGEALASIASISRIILTTKNEKADVGTRVHVDGGVIRNVESIGHPRGTQVQIKNIFYNVPARRKFLKSQQSEMSHISDIVGHYMLGYPEIAFRFTRGNVPVATTTGTGNLLDAIVAVYGPETARSLIPLKVPPGLSKSGFNIRGFISLPNEARKVARYTTTLLNRRFVRSKLIGQALSKALSSYLPKGAYPVLVLDLRIPGELIDVNVHPQKTEVRFCDEKWVFGAIYEIIQASYSGLSLIRENSSESSDSSAYETTIQADLPSLSQGSQEPLIVGAPGDSGLSRGEYPLPRPYELHETLPQSSLSMSSGALEPVQSLHSPRILAQLHHTYILGEDRDGLFIVDQHVAHERVLFDTYVESYRDVKLNSQPLLFPIPLQLLPSERLVMQERFEELNELGFMVKQEKDKLFYATAIPLMVTGQSSQGDKSSVNQALVQDLLAQILGGWESRSMVEIKLDLLKMMACKAAVKAGDPLKDTEMRSLFEQLIKTQNPFSCPHGRPIILRLSLKKIERSFLRS